MYLDSFLNISDLNRELLEKIIFNNLNEISLKNKNIGLLFEKPSTRTRISFSVGIKSLQGNFIDLKLEDLNSSRYESFEDTFKTFGLYLDGLIYRTSNHNNLLKASSLMGKPVINALSDISHPCQTLADLITLYNKFNRLNLTISWFGDVNNVLFSLIEASMILNELEINIFTDKSFFKNLDMAFGKNIHFFDEIHQDVLSRTDCIMTDVFISMNDEENDHKIKLLEKFQVNKNILDLTSDNCIFMHCLPAKVGVEVTKEVFESEKSLIWEQALNRLIAQKRLFKCINW